MEASSEESEERDHEFVRPSRLSFAEFEGVLAAVLLIVSLFLPWFATSDTNDESVLTLVDGMRIHGGDTATAWQTFPILRWFLLAMAIAPFGLLWVVARGHKLDWRPGEVTMVIGVAAFVLVLCNGVILGRPGDTVEISLQWGYPVALLAGFLMTVAGFRRQARSITTRKPPGTI